ncbi:MAG: DNA/RNA nuclease SfsA [Deltaproteobacteria bacterium]|nr:DNA/RNA nuclease SfsA [Deltaproteobacteria bacterium]
MQFETKLRTGILIRRYKRFLADVKLDNGDLVTAHVPNTGSMRSTSAPESPVALSYQPAPHRKLKWTLELIGVEGGFWVGVNTGQSNRIVEEAIAKKRISSLLRYDTIRREVKYGKSSRIDLLLEKTDRRCYVEVKNVTYKEGRRALFPDAVTTRGKKHLDELADMVSQGHRAVIFFLVNRSDCGSMGPADKIDSEYGATLRRAIEHGVEPLAYRAAPTLAGIEIDRKLRIIL